jgi:hypothetical protein
VPQHGTIEVKFTCQNKSILNDMGVSRLITLGVEKGGAKSTLGITNFNLRMSYVRKRETIGLDRPLTYRGTDKSLARPTSRCILFDGENISFDASLVIYK